MIKDGSNKILTGNYGFIYVSKSVLKRLKKYLKANGIKWGTIGSISLVVKAGGQYFQLNDTKFRVMDLISVEKVVEL